jgi:uncharacterized protein (DUF433 family)
MVVNGRVQNGVIITEGSVPLPEGLTVTVMVPQESTLTIREQPSFHPHNVPLRVDEGGVVRVGKSRVSLDLIVEQYENGMTPEDMVRAYDTLVLSDVHDVIAYYLRNHSEVRAYLERRAVDAEAFRAKLETERPRVAREEIQARRGS